MSTAADRDEQAELRALRAATAQSAAQVGETLGALTARASATAHRARATTSRARATARRIGRPVLLAGLPTAALLTVGLLLLQRRLRGTR